MKVKNVRVGINQAHVRILLQQSTIKNIKKIPFVKSFQQKSELLDKKSEKS
jgi:hypothetical protein